MLDLIIVGAGPAGLICAIEAKKASLDYVILEKGLLVNSIYNFPTNMTFFSTSKKLEVAEIPFISHNEKPTRKEALEYYRRLAHHYDLKIKFQAKVESIKKDPQHIQVSTPDETYLAKNIVIATGFYDNPRTLDIPGADLSKVKHYFDDAHPYIGMKVLVVGGANSACDVALETWSNGAETTMAVRKSGLYEKVKYWILPNIENRIKEGSIAAYFNTTVAEIRANEVVLNTPDGLKVIENDYVFAMIGYRPNYDLLKQLGVDYEKNEDLIPSFNPDTFETNVPNVYIAGVINGGLKTSSLFIENTRDHGEKIIKNILHTSS